MSVTHPVVPFIKNRTLNDELLYFICHLIHCVMLIVVRVLAYWIQVHVVANFTLLRPKQTSHFHS